MDGEDEVGRTEKMGRVGRVGRTENPMGGGVFLEAAVTSSLPPCSTCLLTVPGKI